MNTERVKTKKTFTLQSLLEGENIRRPIKPCRRCGKPLKDPLSVQEGIGRDCAEKEANGE
jgi:hypothetical protein